MGKKAVALFILILLFSIPLFSLKEDDWDFAESLFERGMYSLALEEYLQYQKKYPGDKTDLIKLRLGECYFRLGKLTVAEKYFLSAFQVKDFQVSSAYRLAEIYIVQGDLTRAEKYLEFLTQRRDLSPSLREGVLGLQIRWWIGKGNKKEVKKRWESFRKKYPRSSLISYLGYEVGNFFLNKKEKEEAIRIWEDVLPSSSLEIRPHILYSLGRVFLERKEFEKAENCFSRILKEFPQHTLREEARMGKAIALYHSGKLNEALKVLNKIKADKFISQVNYWKGKIMFARGDFDKGKELLLRISRNSPFFEKARFALATELSKRGKEDKAIVYLEEIRKTKGRLSPDSLLLLTQLLAKKDKEKALNYLADIRVYYSHPLYPQLMYQKATLMFELSRFKDVLTLYQEFKRRFPNNPLHDPFLFLTGESYFRLSQWKKAEEVFLTLSERGKEKEWREKGIYYLIQLQSMQGNKGEVLRNVEKFLKIYPRSKFIPELLLIAGITAREEGKPDIAMRFLSRILKEYPRSPSSSNALYLISQIYFEKGEEEKSLDSLLRLLKEYPRFRLEEDTFYWMGNYLADKGRYSEALYVWEEALKRYTDPRIKEKAEVEKGRIEIFTGKIAKGIERLEKFIQEHPSSPFLSEAFYFLGEGFFLTGKGSKALSCWEKSAEGGEFADKALYRIGEFWFSQGKYARAYRYYLKLAYLFENSPLIPSALYQAGKSLKKLGKEKEAVKVWRELLTRFPSSEPSRRLKKEWKEK